MKQKWKKPGSATTPTGQWSQPDLLSKKIQVFTTKKQMYEKLFVKRLF